MISVSPLAGTPRPPPSLCAPFVSSLDVSGASIAVSGLGGRQSTVCTSGPLAARLDALQFEMGEGPRWDVLATRSPALHPDLGAEHPSPWPVFAGSARGLGVEALFSFPLLLGAALVGVVDLCCTTSRAADPAFVSLATLLAGRVAGAAAQQALRSAEDHRSPETPLAPALRREVHQATGMIISQLGVTATEAFARLQGHAFATGRPIDDVAHDVVTRVLSFDGIPE